MYNKNSNGQISVATSAKIENRIFDAIKDALESKEEVTITDLYPVVGDEFNVYVGTYSTLDDFYFDFNIESRYNFWKQNVPVSLAKCNAYELFCGDMLQDIVDIFYNDIVVRFEIREEQRKEI